MKNLILALWMCGAFSVLAAGAKGGATYCIIDLSGGANAGAYPITYRDEAPRGGFNTTEYKTTKLVLKRVEAGSFVMGNALERDNQPHKVVLTRPFYLGVFEVTQRQWELVMGSNPSCFTVNGAAKPVERVTSNDIRGRASGSNWPASNAVDASSFLGRLRARTKLDFDLPTEAQWEYACRAGAKTTYGYGDKADGAYMWCYENSSDGTKEVGTKMPNAWGFYDMHGNVWEWCLDRYATSLSAATDPKGASSGTYRVMRGGGWYYDARVATSSFRNNANSPDAGHHHGFRLALP